MNRLIAVFSSALILVGCSASGPVPVEVVQTDAGYALHRDGKPYEVHGAGLEFGDMAALADAGGNSFRTWRTDNGQQTGQEVLDQAHALGLTVLMCIEIGRERHGFDYDDDKAVADQLAYARGEVEKYKDHPALLGWMIGNEPNLFYENPKVFDAINDISKMIHEVDPHHPTTTALAGWGEDLAMRMKNRAGDVDFLSVQFYGDIVNLPKYLDETGYDGPYMVTEWGAIGHWEVDKTEWEAPIEVTSSAKAEHYRMSHEVTLANDPNLIGSYVFLWGQKQERTPTWYGMFLEDGAKTETIDVMQKIWTGSFPENRAPAVTAIKIDDQQARANVSLTSGEQYPASVVASDPENGELTMRWEVMVESQAKTEGGDYEERPAALPGLVQGEGDNIVLTAPSEPGAYRLFVYVYDETGKGGHANIPFYVNPKG